MSAAPDLQALLRRIRDELARVGESEGVQELLEAIEQRVWQLVHDEEPRVDRLEVLVAVAGTGIEVTICGGSCRDLFHLGTRSPLAQNLSVLARRAWE